MATLSGKTVPFAATVSMLLLLAACGTTEREDVEAVATDGQDELRAEVAGLEERVAELEEEREQLIEQRDALHDELDEVRAAEDAAEVAEDPVEDEIEIGFVEVGEAVRFNDWDFTVTDVRIETSIDRADPPRGSYLVFTLDIENDGTQPRSFLGGARTTAILVDLEAERQYEFDSHASLSYYQSVRSGTWHLDDIGPGLSDTLPLVFDIPDTVGPLLVFAVASGEQVSSGVIVEP